MANRNTLSFAAACLLAMPLALPNNMLGTSPPPGGVTVDHGDTPIGGVDGPVRKKKGLREVTPNRVTTDASGSSQASNNRVSPP